MDARTRLLTSPCSTALSGDSGFEGTITEVYLANTARDDAWVEEAYRTTNTYKDKPI